MKCFICEENEQEYNYVLVDGVSVPICSECGEILYEKNIGGIYKDARLQMILMIEYVKYIKSKTSKVLRIVPRRKASWNFFLFFEYFIVRRV